MAIKPNFHNFLVIVPVANMVQSTQSHV